MSLHLPLRGIREPKFAIMTPLMFFITVSSVLLSLGVSTDTFAASISKGLKQVSPSTSASFWIALIFSSMEMLFLLLGNVIGSATSQFITQIDHWVAFIVLSILGIKMIRSQSDASSIQYPKATRIRPHELLLTAVGTSIDSIAVGVSTAFMRIHVMTFIIMTGVFTFFLSFLGSRFVAKALSYKFGDFAEKLGGSLLIGVGLSILLSHIGIDWF